MKKTIALVLTLFGLLARVALAEVAAMPKPEYILERDAALSTPVNNHSQPYSQAYQLRIVFPEDPAQNLSITFQYPWYNVINQFVVVHNPRTHKPTAWFLGGGVLWQVSYRGVVIERKDLGGIIKIAAGPNNKLLYVAGQTPNLVRSINPDGSVDHQDFKEHVDWITWNGYSDEYLAIIETPGNPKSRDVVAHGMNGSKVIADIDLSKYSSARIRGYKDGVALVRWVDKMAKPHTDLVIQVGSNQKEFTLPNSLNYGELQLLDVTQGGGAHKIYVRLHDDLIELEAAAALNVTSEIKNAFTEHQVTENLVNANRFRYSGAQKIGVQNFQNRFGGKPNAAAPASQAPAPAAPAPQPDAVKKAHDERVRDAVGAEVKRLIDVLRYTGVTQPVTNSAEFVRALEQAGGTTFWDRSLFKDIDMDELRYNPVAMDDLVEVLAQKLPAEVTCKLDLTVK